MVRITKFHSLLRIRRKYQLQFTAPHLSVITKSLLLFKEGTDFYGLYQYLAPNCNFPAFLLFRNQIKKKKKGNYLHNLKSGSIPLPVGNPSKLLLRSAKAGKEIMATDKMYPRQVQSPQVNNRKGSVRPCL